MLKDHQSRFGHGTVLQGGGECSTLPTAAPQISATNASHVPCAQHITVSIRFNRKDDALEEVGGSDKFRVAPVGAHHGITALVASQTAVWFVNREVVAQRAHHLSKVERVAVKSRGRVVVNQPLRDA